MSSPRPNSPSQPPLRESVLESSNSVGATDSIDDEPVGDEPVDDESLHPPQDARELVRIVQCPKCSHILDKPVTLPCGYTICKKCMPDAHIRTNVSFPKDLRRVQGFTCPFDGCLKDHAVEDCALNVILDRIMDIVRRGVEEHRNMPAGSEALLQIREETKWSIAGVASLGEESRRVHSYPGGRLLATYTMAELGGLAYESEVSYYQNTSTRTATDKLDLSLIASLKKASRPELDCILCYSVFVDPFTTTCGHTMCRKCLLRAQDYGQDCPTCRRPLLSPLDTTQGHDSPSDLILSKILDVVCPGAVAQRIEIDRLEESHAELETPLFICTLSFPHTPTFLHVFEPRYRLMMRRVVESRLRRFGMVLQNPERKPQGNLGAVSFYEYGTMLQIVSMQVFHDGRSVIEARGLFRFRILQHGVLDGYKVGKVQRLEDISTDEEEAVEAAETRINNKRKLSCEDLFGPPSTSDSQPGPRPVTQLKDLSTLSTQELMDHCKYFVKKMSDSSARWLHQSVLDSFGPCPDDAAIFPWWLASIIPTSDKQKYKLLKTTSVRERLKMCVLFASELDHQKWYASLSAPARRIILPTHTR